MPIRSFKSPCSKSSRIGGDHAEIIPGCQTAFKKKQKKQKGLGLGPNGPTNPLTALADEVFSFSEFSGVWHLKR